MNEWMNEWMNERMNELMNEWMNEWMNKWNLYLSSKNKGKKIRKLNKINHHKTFMLIYRIWWNKIIFTTY